MFEYMIIIIITINIQVVSLIVSSFGLNILILFVNILHRNGIASNSSPSILYQCWTDCCDSAGDSVNSLAVNTCRGSSVIGAVLFNVHCHLLEENTLYRIIVTDSLIIVCMIESIDQ